MVSSSELHGAPKRRVLAASNIGDLPLDPLYEILLCLPAKILCRLRTVCWSWRSILSDPHFAAVHAARHPGTLIIATTVDEGSDVLVNIMDLSGPPVIATLDEDHEVSDVLVSIMDLSGQILKQVRGVPGQRVMSMARGDLVCLKKMDDNNSRYRCRNRYFGDVCYLPDQLLDPATGAVYQIPDGFAEEHGDIASELNTEPRYWFGQVNSTGEYKVFRKLFPFPLPGGCYQVFEVCTVNGSSSTGWRAVPVEQGIQTGIFTSVVIDGVMYSLYYDPHKSITSDDQNTEKDLIVTFDLETEKWGAAMRGPPISLPDDAAEVFKDLPNIKQLTLANLNGSLAVVHGPAPSMDIWVLIDSAKGLWVKKYIIQFEYYNSYQYVHPLVVLGDGRVVLYKEDMQFLQIYDPRTNTLTDSVEVCHFSAVALFGGNLLSL